MTATPTQTIQTLRDNNHLSAFARQLHQVLSEEMGLPEPFSESRARAILRAANLLDEATQASFQRLVQKESNLRLALHALLVNTAVETTFTPPYPNEAQEVPWLALTLIAFAHKNGYPVGNLNPAAPPAPHSPAGLLLQQVGGFFRHETQRTATERDRQARDLAHVGRTADEAQNASGFAAPIAPVPPYFRSPVPVRYPEFNEPVAVDDEEVASETPSAPPPPQTQTRLTITPEET
ncbi:MAG: hypothetical protein KDD89_07365, partial [Anaerolineales bacterium]|nr:hypothetical protein [Anaerolineales bacterium]